MAGPLAAFGGAYAWTLPPLLAGVLILVAYTPQLEWEPRPIAVAALGIVVAALIQILPLPYALIETVAPVRAQIADGFNLGEPRTWLPLTLDRSSTLHAVTVWIAAVLTFFASRAVFSSQGVRQVCRGITALGLLLACTAMAQRVVSPRLVYGMWQPFDSGALPFGPFVNRNHCATWLIMGLALSIGYFLARRSSRSPRGSMVDSQDGWLVVSAITMALALAASQSRSGILGAGIAVLWLAAAGAARRDRRRVAWLATVTVVAGMAAILFVDAGAALERVDEGLGSGAYGRAESWRHAAMAASDFWMTGTGLGTFATAMLTYQVEPFRAYLFNQAHNHPLQVAAEGGAMVVLPVMVALISFAAAARRRLREDQSGVFWIRAGALAGLCGVLLQSVFETGLRMPANAQLAAVAAALVLHRPHGAGSGSGTST